MTAYVTKPIVSEQPTPLTADEQSLLEAGVAWCGEISFSLLFATIAALRTQLEQAQAYPTVFAYEQACKALHAAEARETALREALREAREWLHLAAVGECGISDGHAGLSCEQALIAEAARALSGEGSNQ